MNFEHEQIRRIEYIEQVLKTYKPEENGYQKIVMEAMNYSIFAGGKRIRPMLMLETFCLFQKKLDTILEPFMAAIEFIHTYSLVHDDLPAMDNDTYRRGRKTTHVVYGEDMAILAGDALLNYAFETAYKSFDVSKENLNIIKAMRILGGKAGIYGMIGGQTVDVESNGINLDIDKLNFIYKLKTSALIEASMGIGAVLANATDEECKTVMNIGSDIGLAFQIQDDILDVTSSLEVLGKPVNSDEKNEKTTYVTIMGIDRAKEEVEKISNRAIEGIKTLQSGDRKNEFLELLVQNLITRNK